MPALLPKRQTDALHRGRVSLSGARYFITLCAHRPARERIRPALAKSLLAEMNDVFCGEDARLLCATIMPDHIHVMFELGERLIPGQLVGKYKAQTKARMTAHRVTWQRDFFEHRLRPEEPGSEYARYIFMNPYRAGLIERRAVGPWWRAGKVVDFDFMAHLDEGMYPPAEWIEEPLSASGLRQADMGPD